MRGWAHPAHLQLLSQLVFDELIGRAGQRLSTQVDEAPKIIQNPPKNCISFFFQKWRASLVSFLFGFFFARFGPCARTNNKRGRKRKKKIFLAPSKCFVWRECVLYAVAPPPPTEIKTERTKSPHRAMMFVDLVRTQFELYQLSEFLFFCGA